MSRPVVHIYTDGASRGNPGPGGYGIVMQWVGRSYTREFSKGFRLTTNNRMELLAVIEALKKLKTPEVDVRVFTDSRYVADAVNLGWLNKWHKLGYRKQKNPDLWKEMYRLLQKYSVVFFWIKGHDNHPQNERCDRIAIMAAQSDCLEIDNNYENRI